MRSLVVILLVGLMGCGAALTPEQQTEFEQYEVRRDQAHARLQAHKNKANQLFKTLSKKEKRKKAIARGGLACGLSVDGQAFGPVPLSFKARRVTLTSSGSKQISGTQCAVLKLGVRK